MKVELHDFVTGAIRRRVPKKRDAGGYTYVLYEFLPDVVYTIDDAMLQDYFRGKVGDINERSIYNADLEAELKSAGVEYKIDRCKTCAHAKPRIVYNPFKILEDK